MRNISNKLMQAMENRRDFYASGEITFASGVKKPLEKKDLSISGSSIYDGGGSSSFPLGLLIPRQINLSLDNHDDRWSEYDFYGAKISLQTKYDFDDGTSEEINIGEYTIVTPESYGTVVGITAVDDSYKADKDYSTSLSFPVSLGVALADSCETCGINLLTTVFPNSDYMIPAAPVSITHRQFIGMCAMIAGGNAKFDEQNRLKIVPYDFSAFENVSWIDGGTFAPWTKGESVDGGSFNPWTSGQNVDGGAFGDRDGIHILYQFAPGIKIEADDVVITGVQMESEGEDGQKVTHLSGKEGYVLSLENQLAKGKEDEALKLIGEKVIGLRFRPFTGDHIALPTAEAMDLAVVVDRKNNAYATVLTDVDYAYFGFTSMKCTADSPIRNMSVYYGNETKAVVQARKLVEAEKTQRELAVEALAKQLANGNGLYMTTEPQTGGGNIYYMHDKPSLKESKVVWKLTANAFGISTDGGKTYPYGLDTTGTAILDRIYAIGIDADHITTGKFEIRKDDGTILALLDKDAKQVILRPDTFTLASGQTVEQVAESKAGSAANDALNDAKSYTDSTAKTTLQSANGYADTASKNAVNNQTQLDIFNKLTDDGKTKGIYLDGANLYINADYVKSGIIDTERLDVEGIFAKNVTATGTIRGVNLVGAKLETESGNRKMTAREANIIFYKKDKETGKIAPIAWGDIEENEGIMLATGSKYLALAYKTEGGTYGAGYILNNGLNPDGYTERNILYGDVRLSDALYFANGATITHYANGGLGVSGFFESKAHIYAADYVSSGKKMLVGNVNYGDDYLLHVNGKSYFANELIVKGSIDLKGYNLNNAVRIYFDDNIYFAKTSVGANFHGSLNVVNGYIVADDYISSVGKVLAGNVNYGDYILQANGDAYVKGTIKEEGILLSEKYAPNSHSHNYLPTSGGTLSGSLTLPNGAVSTAPVGLHFASGAAIFTTSDARHLYFLPNSSVTDYILDLGINDNEWSLVPYKDHFLNLGSPNHKWGTVYAVVGAIQTSDKNKKNDIKPLSEQYESIFEQLKPVSYKLNDGHRTHTGFISQDIEKSLDDNGMTGEDWAAFCKDDDGNGGSVYGLRYEEIIALNTHMIQKLMKRIDELEARIQELEGR